MRKKEKGFAAVWGILLLSMVTFFAAGVYALGNKRIKSAAGAVLTTDMRAAAESGLIAAAAELTANPAKVVSVNNASGEVVFATLTEGDITTRIYLKKDGAGGFHGQATASTGWLSAWEKDRSRTSGTRVIGRISRETAPDGTEKYRITYWEH